MDSRVLHEILAYVDSAVRRGITQWSVGDGAETLGNKFRKWIGGQPSVIRPGQAASTGTRIYASAYDHTHYFYGVRLYEVGGSPDLYAHSIRVSAGTLYDLGSGFAALYTGGGGSSPGTGGNITSQGAVGSEPASPDGGDLFFQTNGFYLKRYNGSAWSAFGPVFPMSEPSVSAPTTWVNQGSATISTTNGAHILSEGGSAVSWRMRDKAAPSTPYTITATFLISGEVNSSYPACGIGWRESSSGKISGIYLNANAGPAPQWAATMWSDPSTFSSNYAVITPFPQSPYLCWARIKDDGTYRYYYYSSDGLSWHLVYQVSRTDFITPNRVMFGIIPRADSKTLAMTLLSWKEE